MPTCCFYICHMEKSKQIHFLPCGVIRFNFGGFGIVLADFLGVYPFTCCDCSIASCVWSKANFSKYARYSIFLPAASYDSAMCAYDSNFGWDCVCDTKVSACPENQDVSGFWYPTILCIVPAQDEIFLLGKQRRLF